MIQLKEELRKSEYTYKLVIREAKKAIYAQYDGEVLIAYEVIKIRVRPQRYSDFLRRYEPEREIYPSSNHWGIMGWTFRNWHGLREAAWKETIERYNEI